MDTNHQGSYVPCQVGLEAGHDRREGGNGKDLTGRRLEGGGVRTVLAMRERPAISLGSGNRSGIQEKRVGE